MLLNPSFTTKIILISLMSLSIGCNQTVQSKAVPTITEAPKTATERAVPAATEASKTAPEPVAIHTPSEPEQSFSNETSTILEGRYWIGHTGQALEVEGDASGAGKPVRYRYETEGGTQPWRSVTELQAVQEGVIYDGNSYWCLSSMAPQGQIASCSEKGWITRPLV